MFQKMSRTIGGGNFEATPASDKYSYTNKVSAHFLSMHYVESGQGQVSEQTVIPFDNVDTSIVI